MAAVGDPAPVLAPLAITAEERDYVLGSATIDRWTQDQGIDPNERAETYLTYAAISNAVYACVNLRATTLSSLPLRFYRLRRGGEREEVTSGRVVELFRRVNPRWTFARLIQQIEWSLCLTGSAFIFLERGASGRLPPRELWWARPDRVRVIPDPRTYVRGFRYQPPGGGQPISYRADEVWWLRYPNPIDEYAGLAPLAAARLAADTANAAMRSNANLFENGIQAGGFIFPARGQPALTAEQQKMMRDLLNREFRGVRHAHRWGVFDREIEVKQLALSPKDAEFLGSLRWTLEDVCRAFGVPLDLIGGQRTYENVQAAHLALWTHTILPEANFLAAEITEQILPLFPREADLAEFDFSGVAVLRASEAERWQIAREQIETGVLTINEYRQRQGEQPLPWGDVWWAPVSLAAVTRSAAPPTEAPRSTPTRGLRLSPPPAYGSADHDRLWRQFVDRTAPWERRIADLTADLFRQQAAEILERLRRPARSAEDAAAEPFDKATWVRRFRAAVAPVLTELYDEAGQQSLDDLTLAVAFDVTDPAVAEAIANQSQRYATHLNDTTYERVKAALVEGIAAGEGTDDLAARVQTVMGGRIADAETIARTEVTAGYNQATLQGWEQSGVVTHKRWLATLDSRVRPTHRAAHGQTVPIDEDFLVGAGRGPAPGLIDHPAEVVRCRCTMVAVLDVERGRVPLSANGHAPALVGSGPWTG